MLEIYKKKLSTSIFITFTDAKEMGRNELISKYRKRKSMRGGWPNGDFMWNPFFLLVWICYFLKLISLSTIHPYKHPYNLLCKTLDLLLSGNFLNDK